MTRGTLDRRRLLAGGSALLGLAVASGCETGSGTATGTASGQASASAMSPTASQSTTTSPAPTASPTPSGTPVPVAPTRVEAPQLADRLDDYLDGRTGDLGLELIDLRRGQTFRFDADAEEGYCYSTVKVLVLTTLLHRLQEADEPLGGRRRRLAEQMITRSDNDATEALLAEIGRDEVRRIGDLVGMGGTTMDEGWWGLWRTTPSDLNRMVGAVLSTDAVLDGSRRAVARFLMADVVPEQRWGVFAPEPTGAYVAAKNGWGPLPDGYRLNSVGWVTGPDHDYQLAIMSNSPEGFRYGRSTISQVSRICHDAVQQGLA